MLNHYLRITPFILLVAISLQLPADFALSPIADEKSIPIGYFDTSDSGAEMAAMDIAAGQPRFALMGLPSSAFVDELERVGIKPIFFGCVIEDKGLQFWEGYNQLIAKNFSL
jgi:hypothetical protein